MYPLSSRGSCTYHLHKNILLRFKGSESFGLVKKAATAFRLSDFNVLFQQIHELNLELHSYLERADLSMLNRVHFSGDRYNFTTSNNVETINKVLRPYRNYHIVALLDKVRMMLTRWFAARRKQACGMTTTLTTSVKKLLQVQILFKLSIIDNLSTYVIEWLSFICGQSRVLRASILKVQEIDPHQYEVRSSSTINVVNLSQNKCTCRMFDLEKLPCIHALASVEMAKVSRITKCHPYYRKDYLCNRYDKSVMSQESCTLPDIVLQKICHSPDVRPQPGRPKTTRVKSALEVALDRKGPKKLHACSQYGNGGQNRTTCKN